MNQLRNFGLSVCLSPDNEFNNQPLPVLVEKNENLEIEKDRNKSELEPQSKSNDKILRRSNRNRKAPTRFV